MKENKKLLLIVGAVLLFSIALLLIMLFGGNKKDEVEPVMEGELVLFSVPKGDIRAFTLGEHSFSYTDSGWIYEDNEALPVAPDFIEKILDRLSVVSAAGIVAEGVNDLSPYGLEDEGSCLSVSADREYSFLLGDAHPQSGGRYMIEEGKDTLFLAGDELYSLCTLEERDFAALRTLPENYATGSVKRVSVDGADYTEEALLKEVSSISLKNYGGFSAEGITDGRKVSIRYSAATEDSYGTAAYSIELIMKAEGDYLLFTYGDDGIIYRLEKTKYPELAKIIE